MSVLLNQAMCDEAQNEQERTLQNFVGVLVLAEGFHYLMHSTLEQNLFFILHSTLIFLMSFGLWDVCFGRLCGRYKCEVAILE